MYCLNGGHNINSVNNSMLSDITSHRRSLPNSNPPTPKPLAAPAQQSATMRDFPFPDPLCEEQQQTPLVTVNGETVKGNKQGHQSASSQSAPVRGLRSNNIQRNNGVVTPNTQQQMLQQALTIDMVKQRSRTATSAVAAAAAAISSNSRQSGNSSPSNNSCNNQNQNCNNNNCNISEDVLGKLRRRVDRLRKLVQQTQNEERIYGFNIIRICGFDDQDFGSGRNNSGDSGQPDQLSSTGFSSNGREYEAYARRSRVLGFISASLPLGASAATTNNNNKNGNNRLAVNGNNNNKTNNESSSNDSAGSETAPTAPGTTNASDERHVKTRLVINTNRLARTTVSKQVPVVKSALLPKTVIVQSASASELAVIVPLSTEATTPTAEQQPTKQNLTISADDSNVKIRHSPSFVVGGDESFVDGGDDDSEEGSSSDNDYIGTRQMMQIAGRTVRIGPPSNSGSSLAINAIDTSRSSSKAETTITKTASFNEIDPLIRLSPNNNNSNNTIAPSSSGWPFRLRKLMVPPSFGVTTSMMIDNSNNNNNNTTNNSNNSNNSNNNPAGDLVTFAYGQQQPHSQAASINPKPNQSKAAATRRLRHRIENSKLVETVVEKPRVIFNPVNPIRRAPPPPPPPPVVGESEPPNESIFNHQTDQTVTQGTFARSVKTLNDIRSEIKAMQNNKCAENNNSNEDNEQVIRFTRSLPTTGTRNNRQLLFRQQSEQQTQLLMPFPKTKTSLLDSHSSSGKLPNNLWMPPTSSVSRPSKSGNNLLQKVIFGSSGIDGAQQTRQNEVPTLTLQPSTSRSRTPMALSSAVVWSSSDYNRFLISGDIAVTLSDVGL